MTTELTTEVNQQNNALTEVAATRQAQEVQAQMVIAQKFPRDEEHCYQKIVQACKRQRLAESALYAYPRGGQMVTGPSIRLAETMARCWKNLDYGLQELEQRQGESTVMAYCHDLESNVRQVVTFQVPHERHTKRGVTRLTDPRDIYELIANQGARRLRKCVLGVIPGDIIDAAVEQVETTLAGGSDEPIMDRVRKMMVAFGELSETVTAEMIEKRLGHKLDATSETELVQLRKIYSSLKDGMSSRDAWFETPQATVDTQDVDDAVTAAQAKPRTQKRK